MKYLIIDGYNAINKIKEFEVKRDISLEASRLALIKALVNFRRKNHLFDRIVAVFDGKGDGLGLGRESYGDIEVLFSNKDKDADRAIIDILKLSSRGGFETLPYNNVDRITVCSDDNFIKNHTRAFGCGVMSIKELENLISLKKIASRGKIIEKDLENRELNDITRELKKHWGVE